MLPEIANPATIAAHVINVFTGQPAIERWECCHSIITARNTIEAHKVHREEYQVGTDKSKPEVQVAQLFVHQLSGE